MIIANVKNPAQKDFSLPKTLQVLGRRKKWVPVPKDVMSSLETVNNNVRALPPIWSVLSVSNFVFNKVTQTSNFVDNIVT